MGKESKFKSSWKNGLIWGSVMGVVLAVLRMVLWYAFIYQGDTGIFSDYFCNVSWPLLLVSFLIPVAVYLVRYYKHTKEADRHQDDLWGVGHGKYGWPMWATLLLLAGVEIAWALVCCGTIYIGCELDLFYEGDKIVLGTFTGLHGGNLALDLILSWVGLRFFKPNEIMESY